MARVSDPAKELEWRARLARFSRADFSVAAFCDHEGVSAASFYLWRRKLQATTASKQPARTATRGAFAPVRLVGAASVSAWLPGGTRLEIPLADPAALEVALQALAAIDARHRQMFTQRKGGDSC